jgi:hypothetical protein
MVFFSFLLSVQKIFERIATDEQMAGRGFLRVNCTYFGLANQFARIPGGKVHGFIERQQCGLSHALRAITAGAV